MSVPTLIMSIFLTLVLTKVIYMFTAFFTDLVNERTLVAQEGTPLSGFHYVNIIIRELVTILGLYLGLLLRLALPNVDQESIWNILYSALMMYIASTVVRVIYLLIVATIQARVARRSQD